MGTLREDLSAAALELRETHISWVFLTLDEVFKVKKPVNLGFLDFRTLPQRRAACEAEISLNRRLSPDVYLGLVPITCDQGGRHRFAGEGETVDWAVHMKRLPDDDRADVRLEQGTLEDAHLGAVAAMVVGFHAACRSDADTASFGRPEAIAVNVRENFEQTRQTIHAHLSPAEAAEIEDWQETFLQDRADLFARRIEAGCVRDGHGDLRLEHVYLSADGSTRILDCIEFNERFRFADVCADVTFFSMDLAYRGHVDLAERFLALYAQEANDYDIYPLVDFYESYRAWVRGKLAAMLAADESAGTERREAAAEEARRYFVLALAAERRPLVPPMVVAVGGIIATGKSTVADELTGVLGGPSINTDRTRKHMLGARPTDKLYDGSWAGAYEVSFTDQVYDEVYRRAGAVLSSGRPVILDASFRSGATRQRARELAEAHGVPFRFVECQTPLEVCRARLQERALGESVSDGRLEIFDDFAARWEPVTELPPEECLAVDTTRPLSETIRSLRERLPGWPEGLNE